MLYLYNVCRLYYGKSFENIKLSDTADNPADFNKI